MTPVVPLSTHPALQRHRGPFDPMTDEDKLAVTLRYIVRSLDPTAVYRMNAGSTIVYYTSPYYRKPIPSGTTTRLVLAPDGSHRRIGPVGFDPR